MEGEKPNPPVFVVVVAQRSSAPVHCAGAQVFHPWGVASRQGSRNFENQCLLQVSPTNFFRNKMKSMGIVVSDAEMMSCEIFENCCVMQAL